MNTEVDLIQKKVTCTALFADLLYSPNTVRCVLLRQIVLKPTGENEVHAVGHRPRHFGM